ncbi:hypothetical protein CUV01_11300 [Paracoccus tegillarcae]|uniref:Uncharacterized protein n=2 Tax=Paracoccus tegillarcae TaxID=1529068 RepID=A0A2K9EX68_9RHOB|nr:hypothetical protein CUV01_11300 [Paracoccus tegillarcae]
MSKGATTVDVVATLDGKGNVVFDYDASGGKIDLTGFYLDINNDGGRHHAANVLDWMVGRDSDGDRMDGFDFTATIGSIWGYDGNNTGDQLVVSMSKLGIDSLSDLDGAELGFNSWAGNGWCKTNVQMANTGTYTAPAEPEDLCDRPIDGENVDGKIAMQDSQITEVTLAYYIPPVIDGDDISWPGDTNGDPFYVVTVSVPAEMGEDPDAYIAELNEAVAALDPNVPGANFLKSVIVTDCDGNSENFAIWFDENGELPDTLSDGLFGVLERDGGELPADIDLAAWSEATYDLTLSGDEFLFA